MIQAVQNSIDLNVVHDAAADDAQNGRASASGEASATPTPDERLAAILSELRPGAGGLWPSRQRIKTAAAEVLRDPEFSAWTNLKLAQRLGCSATTVARIRRTLIPLGVTAATAANSTDANQAGPSTEDVAEASPVTEDTAGEAPANDVETQRAELRRSARVRQSKEYAEAIDRAAASEHDDVEQSLQRIISAIGKHERSDQPETVGACDAAMHAARELAGAWYWLRLVAQSN